MTAAARQLGAAAVGTVADLPPLEAAVVLYLRLWHTSRAAQEEVAGDFARAFGPAGGARMCAAFETFCTEAAGRARRPLMRHDIGCRCLGADESALAHLVATAAAGARDDALLLSLLMVERDAAPRLADLAGEIGRGLGRMFAPAEAARVTHATHTAARH